MKVKELRDILKDADGELEIVVYGCYGSSGEVEKAYVVPEKERTHINADKMEGFVIEADICSG